LPGDACYIGAATIYTFTFFYNQAQIVFTLEQTGSKNNFCIPENKCFLTLFFLGFLSPCFQQTTFIAPFDLLTLTALDDGISLLNTNTSKSSLDSSSINSQLFSSLFQTVCMNEAMTNH